jgi:heme-degrading monooxygenase HmoA
MEVIMFVVIVSFPPIKTGKEAEFEKWFAWSNREFSGFKGFIRRRLLKPLEGGNYAAIVEFEDRETFMAMHGSPIHAKAREQVMPIFDGKPAPHFYEVIIG